MLIAVFAALMLTFRNYFGNVYVWKSFLLKNNAGWKAEIYHWFFDGSSKDLHALLFWSVGCVLFYLLLPALFSRFILKSPLGETGFRLKIPLKHWKIYGILLAGVMPFVIIASFSDHFRETYPFYRVSLDAMQWDNFLLWEVAYLLQFVGVEYFFRGFLLFESEKFVGKNAILVAMIPYCMIHFGKPFPETVGAIIAGVVLGTMALRSRSIIPGILLHYSVALSMDLLSLGVFR